ncbi:MAG: hypothetical protein EA365_09075 [Gloeocapsa sp. DLM2.Bin57]|nr:MAG: hypothetical protein EA365_09075 [Gloeocapsa sp. DLM2.Bin57]
MFITNKEANSEARDCQLVDLAAKAIYVDNFLKAESLLLKVIQNTPTNYIYQYEEANQLVIKFWNQQEFNQYYSWQKKQGIDQQIVWIKSAYPRAFYFLGILNNKTQEYTKALEFIEEGLSLEPTNTKLLLEKAKAFKGLKEYQQALKIYESINQLGPYISKYDIAKALQEKASLHLELGDVDRAEEIYHQSLNWDTYNDLAIHKIKDIQESRESHLGNYPLTLTTKSSHLDNNPIYQSLLERDYLKQAKKLEPREFAQIDKMKNKIYFLVLISGCLLIMTLVLSLISS